MRFQFQFPLRPAYAAIAPRPVGNRLQTPGAGSLLGVCGVLVLCAVVLSGCKSPLDVLSGRGSRGKDPLYAVSLHPVRSPGSPSGRFITRVTDTAGRPVNVSRIPVLTSSDIVLARALATEHGNRTLQIQLDPHGEYVWMQLTAQYGGNEMAVFVDGIYRFLWEVPRASAQGGVVSINGPWNSGEAERVAQHSHLNYKLLNKD